MGKHGKKQTLNHRGGKRASYTVQDGDEQGHLEYPLSPPPSSAQEAAPSYSDQEPPEESEDSKEKDENLKGIDYGVPSKYSLYQQSVQSPKGDISYLQKFFLMYVGGRAPLHLQEDFCGTALLSVEWLHSDARRTAIGLDLDVEALNWCLANNINRIGADVSSRLLLLQGNVLKPLDSEFVDANPLEIIQNLTLNDKEGDSVHNVKYYKDVQLLARDVVCAFNYSCCCLHKRTELILYFKHALNALSKNGGIFVMDLYGGSSSEGALRMQRRFSNFTYIWEQGEFDIIQRKTRISLHFNLEKQHRKIRHAFSYSWKLWSLPEVRDCLEEAGFRGVHFWIREMPDSEAMRCTDGLSAGRDVKYEEATSFEQRDSWNAYIVAVA